MCPADRFKMPHLPNLQNQPSASGRGLKALALLHSLQQQEKSSSAASASPWNFPCSGQPKSHATLKLLRMFLRFLDPDCHSFSLHRTSSTFSRPFATQAERRMTCGAVSGFSPCEWLLGGLNPQGSPRTVAAAVSAECNVRDFRHVARRSLSRTVDREGNQFFSPSHLPSLPEKRC